MKEILKELNVEKLNICEPDGTVKMTLFNSQNIPSMILEGEDIMPGHRSNDGVSGAMFYNNEGDECGGLIYGSDIDDDGEVTMGMSLTFDKWKQDQVLQLNLQKQGEKEQYGISIYDRPEYSIRQSVDLLKEIRSTKDQKEQTRLYHQLMKNNHKRVFIGHDTDGDTKIALYDSKGKEKVKIFIDENDEPQVIVNGKKLPVSRFF